MPEYPVTALIMATLLEAEPFIEAITLEKQADKPCPVYCGDNTVLIISGIGKTNAAIATTIACLRYQPDRICNLGAAGAAGSSIPLGAIYHIDKVVEPDHLHLSRNTPHIHSPDKLHGFETATLATQDRPVKDPDDRQKTALYADLTDMEGAAVLQTAGKFKVPCYLFKFVSDTPHPDENNNIVEQIKRLRTPFCRFFVESIRPFLSKRFR